MRYLLMMNGCSDPGVLCLTALSIVTQFAGGLLARILI